MSKNHKHRMNWCLYEDCDCDVKAILEDGFDNIEESLKWIEIYCKFQMMKSEKPLMLPCRRFKKSEDCLGERVFEIGDVTCFSADALDYEHAYCEPCLDKKYPST